MRHLIFVCRLTVLAAVLTGCSKNPNIRRLEWQAARSGGQILGRAIGEAAAHQGSNEHAGGGWAGQSPAGGGLFSGASDRGYSWGPRSIPLYIGSSDPLLGPGPGGSSVPDMSTADK